MANSNEFTKDLSQAMAMGLAIHQAQCAAQATDVDLFMCVVGMMIGRGYSVEQLHDYIAAAFATCGSVHS